jgi:cupin-like protein
MGFADALSFRLLERFENLSPVSGSCEINILHNRDQESCAFAIDGRAIKRLETPPPQPTARIIVTADLLEDLIANGGDLRNFALAGKLQVEGSFEILQLIEDAVGRRPPTWASEVLGRAESQYATRNPPREAPLLHRPSRDRIVESAHQSTPIIITGELDDWLEEKWTLPGLVERFGDQTLVMSVSGKLETLAAFVEDSSTGETYARGFDIPPAMLPSFPRPSFLSDTEFMTMNRKWPDPNDPPQLWFGRAEDPRVPVTPVHRDLAHVFLAHVFGIKRILLFSPNQAPQLYPRSNFSKYQQCWVKPWMPDLERFPLFANANPIEIFLQPGQILLIPEGWFHEVYAHDGTVMSLSYAYGL